MIKKQIHKPEGLSADSIFQIIEIYFSGRYKTTRQSNSILKVKRLYKYQTSFGWSNITKQLDFNDSGYFKIQDNHLSFKIDLSKQIVFWTLLAMAGLFVLWKVFHVSFLYSCLLIFIPLLIGWFNGLYELSQFIKFELNEISKRLND